MIDSDEVVEGDYKREWYVAAIGNHEKTYQEAA